VNERIIGEVSVRELIALLRKCPDQDAYVVLRTPNRVGGNLVIDGVRPTGRATVELVLASQQGLL